MEESNMQKETHAPAKTEDALQEDWDLNQRSWFRRWLPYTNTILNNPSPTLSFHSHSSHNDQETQHIQKDTTSSPSQKTTFNNDTEKENKNTIETITALNTTSARITPHSTQSDSTSSLSHNSNNGTKWWHFLRPHSSPSSTTESECPPSPQSPDHFVMMNVDLGSDEEEEENVTQGRLLPAAAAGAMIPLNRGGNLMIHNNQRIAQQAQPAPQKYQHVSGPQVQ